MTPGPGRFAAAIAVASSVAVLIVGIAWGTFAAGGSDSTCYLGAARLFTQGITHLDRPLARIAPWPNADSIFTPAGHVPSLIGPGILVPMCPPGLPLMMAAFRKSGLSEFLVVPLLGALTVWLTFVLGRRIDQPWTGAAAATLLACSPIFLYQIVQPMTDIPVAAWWMLAVVLAFGFEGEGRYPFWSGLAASTAVLTRPNLAPLASVIAGYLLCTSSGSDRALSPARFVCGLVPGVALLMLLQRVMYGGALASGYGSPGELFSLGNVVPNLARYPAWLIESHTPFLVLALGAPFTLRRAAHAWMGLALAAVTLACYLPYYVFNDWWYIRFLLPALPLLVISSVVVLATLLRRLGRTAGQAATIVLIVGVAGWWVHRAQTGHAFELRRLDEHYTQAGKFVADRLPDRAVIITVRHSGSVYYSAGRQTILWDLLDPARFESALAFLREQGYVPYLLLESDEEHVFRERFGTATPMGWLDWPPLADIGQRIRVYDPRDRSRFLANEDVRTEYVWETPRTGLKTRRHK